MFRVPKMLNWIAPLSISERICGVPRVVIQSSPSWPFRSSWRRSWLISPRSPTSTTCSMPKRSRTFSICPTKPRESAQLPLNTSTATSHPSGAHRRPMTLWSLSELPSRLCPSSARGTVAVCEVCRGDIVEVQGTASQLPGRQFCLDSSLLTIKPIRGKVEIVLACSIRLRDLSQPAGSAFRIEPPGCRHLGLRTSDENSTLAASHP